MKRYQPSKIRNFLQELQDHHNETKPPLFILYLEISPTKKDSITFKRGDKPELLALKFCRKHGLQSDKKVFNQVLNCLKDKILESELDDSEHSTNNEKGYFEGDLKEKKPTEDSLFSLKDFEDCDADLVKKAQDSKRNLFRSIYINGRPESKREHPKRSLRSDAGSTKVNVYRSSQNSSLSSKRSRRKRKEQSSKKKQKRKGKKKIDSIWDELYNRSKERLNTKLDTSYSANRAQTHRKVGGPRVGNQFKKSKRKRKNQQQQKAYKSSLDRLRYQSNHRRSKSKQSQKQQMKKNLSKSKQNSKSRLPLSAEVNAQNYNSAKNLGINYQETNRPISRDFFTAMKKKRSKLKVDDRLYLDAKDRQARHFINQISREEPVGLDTDEDNYQLINSNNLSKSRLNRSKSKVSNRSNISQDGVKASNRLYYWGVQKSQFREKQRQNALKLKEKLELSTTMTDKPKINNISNMIASRARYGIFGMNSKADTSRTAERLIKYGEAVRYKKNKMKMMKDRVEMNKYTFRPATNPK